MIRKNSTLATETGELQIRIIFRENKGGYFTKGSVEKERRFSTRVSDSAMDEVIPREEKIDDPRTQKTSGTGYANLSFVHNRHFSISWFYLPRENKKTLIKIGKEMILEFSSSLSKWQLFDHLRPHHPRYLRYHRCLYYNNNMGFLITFISTFSPFFGSTLNYSFMQMPVTRRFICILNTVIHPIWHFRIRPRTILNALVASKHHSDWHLYSDMFELL